MLEISRRVICLTEQVYVPEEVVMVLCYSIVISYFVHTARICRMNIIISFDFVLTGIMWLHSDEPFDWYCFYY